MARTFIAASPHELAACSAGTVVCTLVLSMRYSECFQLHVFRMRCKGCRWQREGARVSYPPIRLGRYGFPNDIVTAKLFWHTKLKKCTTTSLEKLTSGTQSDSHRAPLLAAVAATPAPAAATAHACRGQGVSVMTARAGGGAGSTYCSTR